MPLIRTIKPDFWVDEKVVECSVVARLLFIGLWNFADNDGRMEYRPAKIKMQIFPADSHQIPPLIDELKREGLVSVYAVDDKEYLQVTNFAKHQKIDKRYPSKYPPPPIPADPRRFPPKECNGREGKVKEYIYERKVSLPKDFAISERVEKWAEEKGHQNLDEHLESFRLTAEKGDYKYKNWCSAFMEAIRNDWAKLGGNVRPEDDPYHGAIQ